MAWTIPRIKAANRAAGFHWFDEDTLAFFDSRVEDAVYEGPGGVFFVSSEQFHGSDGDSGPRRWTVRRFDPETADIETVGPFNVLDRDAAREAARQLASGTMTPRDIVAE
jgi:hypothetical protein